MSSSTAGLRVSTVNITSTLGDQLHCDPFFLHEITVLNSGVVFFYYGELKSHLHTFLLHWAVFRFVYLCLLDITKYKLELQVWVHIQ